MFASWNHAIFPSSQTLHIYSNTSTASVNTHILLNYSIRAIGAGLISTVAWGLQVHLTTAERWLNEILQYLLHTITHTPLWYKWSTNELKAGAGDSNWPSCQVRRSYRALIKRGLVGKLVLNVYTAYCFGPGCVLWKIRDTSEALGVSLRPHYPSDAQSPQWKRWKLLASQQCNYHHFMASLYFYCLTRTRLRAPQWLGLVITSDDANEEITRK